MHKHAVTGRLSFTPARAAEVASERAGGAQATAETASAQAAAAGGAAEGAAGGEAEGAEAAGIRCRAGTGWEWDAGRVRWRAIRTHSTSCIARHGQFQPRLVHPNANNCAASQRPNHAQRRAGWPGHSQRGVEQLDIVEEGI